MPGIAGNSQLVYGGWYHALVCSGDMQGSNPSDAHATQHVLMWVKHMVKLMLVDYGYLVCYVGERGSVMAARVNYCHVIEYGVKLATYGIQIEIYFISPFLVRICSLNLICWCCCLFLLIRPGTVEIQSCPVADMRVMTCGRSGSIKATGHNPRSLPISNFVTAL